ncbi:hypothetical protein COO60DRAFT_1490290 [Scenedesmus sp. NREL 46B-D3]|nr:hypothetical protein COO60DRAFT_1490290 [Scenedesmus sp. NREL 46B-D3]
MDSLCCRKAAQATVEQAISCVASVCAAAHLCASPASIRSAGLQAMRLVPVHVWVGSCKHACKNACCFALAMVLAIADGLVCAALRICAGVCGKVEELLSQQRLLLISVPMCGGWRVHLGGSMLVWPARS